MEVLVFSNQGKTFHFKNVTNFKPTTQGFEFEYVGVATGVKRHINFNYTSTMGYAIAEEDK